MSVTSVSASPDQPQATRRTPPSALGTRLTTGCAALRGYGVVGPPRRRGAGRAVPEDALRGMFPIWQPRYAAHGIATFPVRIIERDPGKYDKVPATRGYLRTGIRGSTALARKFLHADALGIACGQRNKLVVCDVDTTNENVLADALSRYGPTPLIIRTASRKWHAYYRHNGERRQIRPDPNVPIDILGGGFVVAPPSRAGNGCYEIVQGSLDDLDKLPVMRGFDVAEQVTTCDPEKSLSIPHGQRNAGLWTHCMRAARRCDSFDALFDIAKENNKMNCQPPLPEDEVAKVAASAWKYTATGQNRFGQHGAWFSTAEVATLIADQDQDALILLAFLRANNGPWGGFMCTNTLAEQFKWGRPRLAHARARLVQLGYIRCLRRAGRGHPALFQWA